jgi:hypothetical protein
MVGQVVMAVYRGAFAILTLVAIAVQALALAAQGGFNPGNFLSFFTIQSNLIAAGVFIVGAEQWRSQRAPGLDFARGAAAVYMAVTGVVFFLLLRDIDVETRLSWVNSVVHEVMPLAVVADWLIDAPRAPIALGRALLWLAYPGVWIGYTLVRGAVTGWYPYPFVNPANGGYARVAVACRLIGLLVAVLCVIVAAAGSALRTRVLTTAFRPR